MPYNVEVIVKLKKKKVSKAFAIAMFIVWLMVIVVVGGPLYIAGRGLPTDGWVRERF